jgi:signal peptidase I
MDNFRLILPTVADDHGAVASWVVESPSPIEEGDLVVPKGKDFMMGDNRRGSYDSRYWGLVPREDIIGRPLNICRSFVSNESDLEKTGLGKRLAWMAHVALHFFSDTRSKRTFHRVQ